MYYVSILKCGDHSPYTGFTMNLKERFTRHQHGHVPATKFRLPVQLIFYCGFTDKYKALAFEKYLKSGSGRAFMIRHLSDKIHKGHLIMRGSNLCIWFLLLFELYDLVFSAAFL